METIQPSLFDTPAIDWRLIHELISKGTQLSIALNQMVLNGSTTVRDLIPYMNAPHGILRDIQKRGVRIYTKDEFVQCANGKRAKIHRYYLEKPAEV